MRVLKSRLLELEIKRRDEELAKERGEAQDISFGSQIRSYVLHPYTMVNDHRTGLKDGNATGVLDGDLDPFIRSYLLHPRDRCRRPRLARICREIVAGLLCRRGFVGYAGATRMLKREGSIGGADTDAPITPVDGATTPSSGRRRAPSRVQRDDLSDASARRSSATTIEAQRRRAEALRGDGARHRRVRAPARAQAERDDAARERHEDLPGQRDGPEGRLAADRQGRMGVPGRRVRIRQVHDDQAAAEGDRRDPRQRHRRRPLAVEAAPLARAAAAPQHRLRLPGLQAAAEPHRVRQRRLRARGAGPAARRDRAEGAGDPPPRRPRREDGEVPERALRRPGAARLDRARVREPPAAPDLRRAHRATSTPTRRSASCSCCTASSAPAPPC